MIKKFLMYALRWQLSTPILAVCVIYFKPFGDTVSTIIANAIGACIFFWVDRWLFRRTTLFGEIWEVRDTAVCADCKVIERGYRLVRVGEYDKTDDKHPEFRCIKCSARKYHGMFKRNVKLARKEGKV